MKYYAVTEDPNELMHFGIKGMKWGVIRTPEQLGHHKAPKKPRSPAYMKASAKLSKAMRQGIAKAQANWDAYNSPENKQIRAEKRAINKEISAYNRAEKKFQKHLQQARQGRLKYKGISDDEVSRITDRLALERQSRLLSGTEKASFGRRLRERVGEGIIEGVGKGTSGYISERMTGRGRTTANIKSAQRMAKFDLSRKGQRVMRREAQAQADREYYKQMAEDGEAVESRSKTVVKNIAKSVRDANNAQIKAAMTGQKVPGVSAFTNALSKQNWSNATRAGRAHHVSEKQREAEERKRRQEQQSAFDKSYYSNMGKHAAEAHQYKPYQLGFEEGKAAGSESNAGASSRVIRTQKQAPASNVKQTSTDLIFYGKHRRKNAEPNNRGRAYW